MEDLSNAAKSAYTYLITNPKDEDTLVNLHFYMEQDGFNREKMLVDTLQKPFERLYMEGVQFYDSEEWNRCSETFERSLEEFFSEDKKCRLQCEDFLDWSSVDTANPELSIVFTSFYTSFVRCRNRCAKDLFKINGRQIPNFLASYFEYMHVCQFKINKGRDACHSVANAILLNPKNILMRRNKLFYMKSYEKTELFEPTPEIEDFYKRMELERRFIEFIDQKFQYVDKQLSPSHIEDRRLLDTQVDISDDFDYSQLQQPFIKKEECERLVQAASIPLPKMSFKFKDHLIEELSQRITNIYGDAPTFHKLVCVPSGSTQTSGCVRGAFILGLGPKNDADTCGAILADRFTGFELQLEVNYFVQRDLACTEFDCSNKGRCLGTKSTAICLCDSGFVGNRCESKVCNGSAVCSGNGLCVGTTNNHTCICNVGFSGQKCEKTVNIGIPVSSKGDLPSWGPSSLNTCSSADCNNKGVCIGTSVNPTCICYLGYAGQRCESNVINAVNAGPHHTMHTLKGDAYRLAHNACSPWTAITKESALAAKTNSIVFATLAIPARDVRKHPILYAIQLTATTTDCVLAAKRYVPPPFYTLPLLLIVINSKPTFVFEFELAQKIKFTRTVGTLCDSSDCNNQGICMGTKNTFTCLCNLGYSGRRSNGLCELKDCNQTGFVLEQRLHQCVYVIWDFLARDVRLSLVAYPKSNAQPMECAMELRTSLYACVT
uniref:EGF-like domain-containing protein n=1 Tax=Ditylenchus dipsaci TaxID=166011 RepID=A0A915EG61_9BILA